MQKSGDKYFNLDPTTVIFEEIKIAKALYITCGGKLWVPETNKFFKRLEGLQEFCLEEMRTIWLKYLQEERKLFLSCETEKEYSNFEHHCLILMQASKIIQKMELGATSEEVKKLVDKQGNTACSFAQLAGLILAFYKKGIEFFEMAVPLESDREFYKSKEDLSPSLKSLQRIYRDRCRDSQEN